MRAVVVGGGLAGAAAALELAARGAETRLVRRGPGATALTWGSLDVAGASPLRRGGLALREMPGGPPLAPLRRLEAASLLPNHPYGTLFRACAPEPEVKAAAAALDAWLSPAGLSVVGSLDETSWLADVHGVVHASDLSLAPAGAGGLGDAAEVVLVELPGLAGYEARGALRTLAAELAAVGLAGRPLRLVRLALPGSLEGLAHRPARLARALEDAAAWAPLEPELRALRGAGRLVLFPPVLGLERPDRVLAFLREATGVRVAELLGAPPLTLAGARLLAALEAALARAGVEVRTGRATGIVEEDGRAGALLLESEPGGPPERLPFEAGVLATGRFVGGGIVDREGCLAEPLLALPLHDLAGRRVDGVPARRLVRRDYEGEQPLFAAGVRTDAALRPLGADGRPRFANLFAAGDLLGGFDPARERDGLGVALLTGRRAGTEAARAAKGEAA